MTNDPWAAGDTAECVFCHPEMQPAALLETGALRLLPDLFPVVPGHLLVTSVEHVPCFGAAPPAVLAGLDELADHAAAFVRDAYGVEPVRWENGGAGQTVFHAHLHLMPVVIDDLIERLAAAPDSIEVSSWTEVAEYYRAHGGYHYAEAHSRRHLLEGNGFSNWEFRRLVALSAGFRQEAGRWVRATTPDDVTAVGPRWQAWQATSSGKAG